MTEYLTAFGEPESTSAGPESPADVDPSPTAEASDDDRDWPVTFQSCI
jgi:hypothetical protein